MKITRSMFPFFLAVSYSAGCFSNVENTFNQVKSDPNALYAFLKEMPKGGELHYHLSGSAYPESMLQVAADENYCLDTKSFTMVDSTQPCTGVKARDLPNSPSLYQQTIRAWSMKNFIPGNESGEDHFFAAFYKFGSLVYHNHVPFLAEVMQRAADQHELYMEVMIMPDLARSTKFAPEKIEPADYPSLKKRLLADVDFQAEIDNTVNIDYIEEARRSLGCDKSPDKEVCQLTVKFQYHTLREQPLSKFFTQALHAFASASRSKTIVGVNTVQPEDAFIALRDYRSQMGIFNFMHKEYPDVHISLHAGELAPEDVKPEDLRFHIHDAIAIGHAERIGHGVDIAYEDNAESLVKLMATKPVPVEINLTSNKEILSISGKKHPLRYYLNHHVPVVLSTDDEGILRTDLTRQYVIAVMDHGVDYPTLKQINRNALSYNFLPGKNLWASIGKTELVPECRDLNSQSCLEFVNSSEKAKLQRNLELKLEEFEKRYR